MKGGRALVRFSGANPFCHWLFGFLSRVEVLAVLVTTQGFDKTHLKNGAVKALFVEEPMFFLVCVMIN